MNRPVVTRAHAPRQALLTGLLDRPVALTPPDLAAECAKPDLSQAELVGLKFYNGSRFELYCSTALRARGGAVPVGPHLGRLSALGVFRRKSGSCGAFVWARTAIDSP